MLLPDCPHAPGLLVGIDRESDQVHTGTAGYGGKCEAARILTAHEKGCLGCVLNADGIPPPRLDVQGRGPGGVRSLKSPQLPCSCQTIHPIRELLQVSMSRSERFVGPPYRGESAAAADGSLGRESGGLCRPDDS